MSFFVTRSHTFEAVTVDQATQSIDADAFLNACAEIVPVFGRCIVICTKKSMKEKRELSSKIAQRETGIETETERGRLPER